MCVCVVFIIGISILYTICVCCFFHVHHGPPERFKDVCLAADELVVLREESGELATKHALRGLHLLELRGCDNGERHSRAEVGCTSQRLRCTYVTHCSQGLSWKKHV